MRYFKTVSESVTSLSKQRLIAFTLVLAVGAVFLPLQGASGQQAVEKIIVYRGGQAMPAKRVTRIEAGHSRPARVGIARQIEAVDRVPELRGGASEAERRRGTQIIRPDMSEVSRSHLLMKPKRLKAEQNARCH